MVTLIGSIEKAMKRKCSVLIVLIFAVLSLNAQHEILTDRNGKKMLKGMVSRSDLSEDSAFTAWYHRNLQGYMPDSLAIEALRKNKDLEFIVFMGTWCPDSQFIIPKFFRLLQEAEFPEEQVTMLATDRYKKTSARWAEAFAIRYVPTIIVMVNGKEAGRVVEYGASGKFDRDLAQLIASLN